MKKSRARTLAILGITAALIIVLQAAAELLQKLGLSISIALGLLPVLVVAQSEGPKIGALAGTFFGLVSLVIAVIYSAAIPMYAIAMNPLVSVLPRILVGVFAGLLFGALQNLHKKANTLDTKHTVFDSVLATLVGVVTNTVLFLGMFLAFAHGNTYGELTIDFRWVLSTIVAINTVIEVFVFLILVPPIVLAVKTSARAAH